MDSRSRFDEVVRFYRPMLERFARRLTRDEAEADDLVQDTVERALRKFETMPEDCRYGAWMTRIMRNQFIDQYRRKRRAPTPLPIGPDMDVPARQTDDKPPWADITSQQLHDAAEQLPEDLRQVWDLRTAGRSYQEIAQTLGIPKNTVGTRLRTARLRLRKSLFPEASHE